MKNCLEYKEYLGSIEFDPDGPAFVGKLLYIRDVITYSATTADSLVKAFHEAVDDYLETCEKLGDKPETPFKGTFNVRTGPELHRKAAIKARNREQSLNDLVCEALTNFVQNDAPNVSTHATLESVEILGKTLQLRSTASTQPTHLAGDKLVLSYGGEFMSKMPPSAPTRKITSRKKVAPHG